MEPILRMARPPVSVLPLGMHACIMVKVFKYVLCNCAHILASMHSRFLLIYLDLVKDNYWKYIIYSISEDMRCSGFFLMVPNLFFFHLRCPEEDACASGCNYCRPQDTHPWPAHRQHSSSCSGSNFRLRNHNHGWGQTCPPRRGRSGSRKVPAMEAGHWEEMRWELCRNLSRRPRDTPH